MARTKQTARRSTGGRAPRKQLMISAPVAPVAPVYLSDDDDWSVVTEPCHVAIELSSPADSSCDGSCQLQSGDGDIFTVPIVDAAFESLTLSVMLGSDFGENLQLEPIAALASCGRWPSAM